MLKEKLQLLRTSKKLSQTKVASLLCITRQAYNNYETGIREPSIETVNQLANLFDVSTDYLLGREDEQKKIRSSEEERILDLLENDSNLRKLIDAAARLTPSERAILAGYVDAQAQELSKKPLE